MPYEKVKRVFKTALIIFIKAHDIYEKLIFFNYLTKSHFILLSNLNDKVSFFIELFCFNVNS